MQLVRAIVPVAQISSDLREVAKQAGAIDEDGFVTIDNRYCAFPQQADKVYLPNGQPITIIREETKP